MSDTQAKPGADPVAGLAAPTPAGAPAIIAQAEGALRARLRPRLQNGPVVIDIVGLLAAAQHGQAARLLARLRFLVPMDTVPGLIERLNDCADLLACMGVNLPAPTQSWTPAQTAHLRLIRQWPPPARG